MLIVKILLVSLSITLLEACAFGPERQLNPSPFKYPYSEGIFGVGIERNTRLTGIVFSHEKLYLPTSIGIVEIFDGKPKNVYKWFSGGIDTVEGLAEDKSTGYLWGYHSRLDELITFDGKDWTSMKSPWSGVSSSRSERFGHVQGFSSNLGFWMQNGDRAWKLGAENTWIQQDVPSKDCVSVKDPGNPDPGCYVSIAPTAEGTLLVMHRGYIGAYFDLPNSKAPKPPPDRIFYLDKNRWSEIISDGIAEDFVTKEIVVGGSCAYGLSFYGTLWKISSVGATKIDLIGEIEAMTTTTSGNLLVSFRDKGIYEYDDGWQKRFDSPYPAGGPEHRAFLAEGDGQVAFAIESQSSPGMIGSQFMEGAEVWISEANSLQAVPLGN